MIMKEKAEYEKETKVSYMLELRQKDQLETLLPPRVFNTHLSFDFLPRKALEHRCKVLWMQRNLKDIAVSAYHHRRDVSPPGYHYMDWEDHLFKILSGQGNMIHN